MKKLAIAVILGALLLGLVEEDCTGAAVLTILFTPVIFQKKKAGVKNVREK